MKLVRMGLISTLLLSASSAYSDGLNPVYFDVRRTNDHSFFRAKHAEAEAKARCIQAKYTDCKVVYSRGFKDGIAEASVVAYTKDGSSLTDVAHSASDSKSNTGVEKKLSGSDTGSSSPFVKSTVRAGK